MNKKRTDIGALIAYLAVCITWGTTYLVIRIVVQQFPPLSFSGIRFILSGLIIMGFALIRKEKFPTDKKDIWKTAFAGLLMLLGGHGLVVIAEQWVHSGVTALILSLGPIFIALLELIILKQKTLNLVGWAGLFVGFGGVMLLVFSGKEIGNIDLKGCVLLLTACALFALGTIFSKKYSTKGSIIPNLAIQMLAGGIGLLLTGGIMQEYPKMTVNFTIVWSMAYLTVFGGVVGYGAYIYLIKHWSAAKAGTYAYVNTVIAVILGALILKEPLNSKVIFSLVLILSGVITVQFSKLVTEKAKEKI